MSRIISRQLNSTGIFILLLLVAACRSEQEDVTRNDAIRYYLNQGDYHQAISLLKDRIDENPNDDKAKILLSSAYSGSVGINTIDSFEVLRPKLFDKPLGDKASSNITSPSSENYGLAENHEPAAPFEVPSNIEEDSLEERQRHAILAIEHEFLKFASQSTDAIEVAFRLPHVPLADRDRIVLGMSVLGDIAEDSDEYLTAQLYQGILAIVQFMNYFRDAIPPEIQDRPGSQPWYLSIYCQMDLGILLPNLSQSVEYLAAAFDSLRNAGRKSANPLYSNLAFAKSKLVSMNRTYLLNQDLFEFADWSLRVSKDSVCER
jgi:hypothetical protein